MKRQFSKIVVCCAACVTQGWGQSNDKSKQLVANSKPTLPPFSEHWEAHGYILEKLVQSRCELEKIDTQPSCVIHG